MPKQVGCGYVYFKNRFCRLVTGSLTSNPYKPTWPNQNFKSKILGFFSRFFYTLSEKILSLSLWFLIFSNIFLSNLSLSLISLKSLTLASFLQTSSSWALLLLLASLLSLSPCWPYCRHSFWVGSQTPHSWWIPPLIYLKSTLRL